MTKKGTLFTVTATSLLLCATSKSSIVINEIYSGGGANTGTPAFRTDFIELFNNGSVAVDVTGFRLDYGSTSQAAGSFPTVVGTFGATTAFGVAPIILPGGFLLIQTGSSGSAGATDVAPDFDFTGASLSAASGAIRLEDASLNILDIVGWGTTNNYEGTGPGSGPVTAPANTGLSMQRNLPGVDTNNNLADFYSTDAPTPIALAPEPSAAMALLGACGLLTGILRRRR